MGMSVQYIHGLLQSLVVILTFQTDDSNSYMQICVALIVFLTHVFSLRMCR